MTLPAKQYRVELLTKPTVRGETVILNEFDGRAASDVYYASITDLPQWVQERIAVLTVGASVGGYVEGVGQRMMDSNVFWIDVPLG